MTASWIDVPLPFAAPITGACPACGQPTHSMDIGPHPSRLARCGGCKRVWTTQ